MQILKYRRNLIPVLLLVGLGVIAFAWGMRGTAAPGPGSQQYPALGHASDFSWIAGTLELEENPNCMSSRCGCIILRYGDDGERVQLDIPSWFAYRQTHHQILMGTSIVVVGHLGPPGQRPSYVCPIYPKAPVYFVDTVQMNPVR